MEHLKPRTAEDCKEYIKPEVNLKELEEEYMSSCGCNPDHPQICTDLDVKIVDGVLKCEASEDCQQSIRKVADIWKEGPITNPDCLLAFELLKFQEDICVN